MWVSVFVAVSVLFLGGGGGGFAATLWNNRLMQNKFNLHELPGHTMYERLHKLSYVYSTHVLFGYKICIMCTVFGPSHTH